MQFGKIRSIHFTAQITQSGTMESGPFAGRKFSIHGHYRFWNQGEKYRIEWRVRQAIGAPIHREIWAFDGKRYQSILLNGPRGTLVINRRKPTGTMGPTEPNPILGNIYAFLNRSTKRRPGNWLDFGRVSRFPKAVARFPSNIQISQFIEGKGSASLTYHIAGEFQRWPRKWPLMSPPPSYFRPGRKILELVEMRQLPNGVLAPKWCMSPPVERGNGGRIVRGMRYDYKGFRLPGGRTVYLPVKEISVVPGKPSKVWMAITSIQVDKPINPGLFEINYDLASTVYEGGKFFPAKSQRSIPAQVQHLGTK
jgi:hypothetical protein